MKRKTTYCYKELNVTNSVSRLFKEIIEDRVCNVSVICKYNKRGLK